MATIRLQKILARAGVASRRAAEELIASGRVRVDGRIVTQMGTKVEARDSRVEVDGTRVVREEPIYVALHKPRGVVSTMHDPEGRPSVRQLLTEVPARVFPVGRLDFNTSGVLLATNDGEFTDVLLHPRRAVPKTYVVKVQGVMGPRDLETWRRGVELDDGKTLPAKVKLLRHEGDKSWLELTITEGRNQQVRRMGDATRFRVMRLARTAFAGIRSEALAPGRWRYLTADELKDLKKEYGVPKRVVSPPAPPKNAARRPPPRMIDAHGRQLPAEPTGPSRSDSGGGEGVGAGPGLRSPRRRGEHAGGDAKPGGRLRGRGGRGHEEPRHGSPRREGRGQAGPGRPGAPQPAGRGQRRHERSGPPQPAGRAQEGPWHPRAPQRAGHGQERRGRSSPASQAAPEARPARSKLRGPRRPKP